ncbi:ABC transporter permease [Bacillus sp. JCM 19041]|uniref:ABC transporter permease n=1 Tax=Bacillus sp. JCM 19041 TaxID=1460637 RepID=UPI0006D1FD8A
MWEQQFMGESSGTEEFVLYRNTDEWVNSVIVESMLDYFMMQLTFYQAVEEPMPEIGEVVLQGEEPVSSFQYYTFGMGVMYVFFSAGFIATFAFHEKKSKVYSRLVLANIPPSHYLIGKAMASIGVVLTQMFLLFGVCFALFQITIINWLGFLFIAFCLSVAVAGISALLISIQFRYHTEKAANVFMFSIISILAFLGGSFFRIADMAPGLAQIGNWTPNGRALSAFIQASQGEPTSILLPSCVILLGFGIVFLVIAWAMFPNKGGAAK